MKLIITSSYKIAKTLYHGTALQNIDSIKQTGLVPSVGSFTANAYDEYTDAGHELPELVFMADKQRIHTAITAMMAAVAASLGRRSLHEITLDELTRYGALVVIQEPDQSDVMQRPEEYDSNWEMQHSDTHITAEPGDHYSEDSQSASYVLTGQKLVKFLQQRGEWPPMKAGGFEDQSAFMKQKLVENGIKTYRQKYPQMPVAQIKEMVEKKIAVLNKTQIEQWYEKLVRSPRTSAA
jgi:hypothetical protein